VDNELSEVQRSSILKESPLLVMENNDLHPVKVSPRSNLANTTTWRGRAGGRFIRLLLLALTVCAIWLTVEDRWGSDFQFPTRYIGDSHYILGMMKLAKDGDLGLFTHITTESLGAPFIGQLNDFPEVERVIVWLGGQIARLTGLIPASNIMLLISCSVSAVSFYCAARLWKLSRSVSWFFAIVYAFLPQSQRSLDHIGVGFTGLLPLQFYCLWYVATVQKLSWGAFRFRLTCVLGALSGLLNIYWIFFFLNVYLLAVLCRVLKRRKEGMISTIPFLATCLAAGLTLGSFIVYRFSYGVNDAALVRPYFYVEIWALKPMDMLIPNWISYLDISSRYYNGGGPTISETWWGSYIGLCAITGLFFLFFKSIQRQVNKRSPSLPFLTVCWIIAYSSFGGINSFISLILDFYDIRSTNRYSEAIATIGLLYFSFIVYRLTRNWTLKGKLCLLTLVALFSIIDQSFKIHTFPFYENMWIKDRVTADRALALSLEERLGEGAMIYMLPAVHFPEPFSGRGARELDYFYYNSMRPFLYSTKLRYSYGSNKGRQGADWQLDVQELPAGEMAAMLESYGFSGILLDRKGYEDRGEQRLAELSEAGWSVEFECGVEREWVFIRLTPSKSPIVPTLTPYALSAAQ